MIFLDFPMSMPCRKIHAAPAARADHTTEAIPAIDGAQPKGAPGTERDLDFVDT
jgi:hypothetical protein